MRLGTMGDQAEAVFEAVWPDRWVRAGWNRPTDGRTGKPLPMSDLGDMERYRPDYLSERRYIEVQGFGNDQIAKFKLDKLGALAWWNKNLPVHWFLYDSANKCWATIPFENIPRLCTPAKERFFENDGNRYYAITAEELRCDWVPT